MKIETNAQTSRGPEEQGAAHPSLTAGTNPKTSSGDPNQEPPEQRWTGRLARAGQAAEIREERIAAIQTAIANGTYQISAEQTAEAILSEHLVRDEAAA